MADESSLVALLSEFAVSPAASLLQNYFKVSVISKLLSNISFFAGTCIYNEK